MREARMACTVAGTRANLNRLDQMVAAAPARKGLRLNQRADAFLKEERIALRLRDEPFLERLDGGVGAQQGVEQLTAAFGR